MNAHQTIDAVVYLKESEHYIEQRIKSAVRRRRVALSPRVIKHLARLIFDTNAGYHRGPDQTAYIDKLISNSLALSPDDVLLAGFSELYNYKGTPPDNDEFAVSDDQDLDARLDAAAAASVALDKRIIWPYKKPVDIKIQVTLTDLSRSLGAAAPTRVMFMAAASGCDLIKNLRVALNGLPGVVSPKIEYSEHWYSGSYHVQIVFDNLITLDITSSNHEDQLKNAKKIWYKNTYAYGSRPEVHLAGTDVAIRALRVFTDISDEPRRCTTRTKLAVEDAWFKLAQVLRSYGASLPQLARSRSQSQ